MKIKEVKWKQIDGKIEFDISVEKEDDVDPNDDDEYKEAVR